MSKATAAVTKADSTWVHSTKRPSDETGTHVLHASADACSAAATAERVASGTPAPVPGADARSVSPPPRSVNAGGPRTFAYSGIGTAVRMASSMGRSLNLTARSRASPCARSPSGPSRSTLALVSAFVSSSICFARRADGRPTTAQQGVCRMY